MRIEGVIIEVFETWPLQLSVEAPHGRHHIGLRLETKVILQGHPITAGELKSHHRVRIDGVVTGPNALIAESIEVLS